jgi:uncharacterized tellurite resistance protein B-like protein
MGTFVAMLPTVDDRMNFLKGLVFVGLTDSELSQEEVLYFRTAAASLGLSPEEADRLIVESQDQQEPELTFSSPATARFFIREVAQLACVDGRFSSSEKSRICHLAAALTVPTATVDKIFDWVQVGLEWRTAGDTLLKEG